MKLIWILIASATMATLAAQSIQITSPANGAIVRPGQSVTITVRASGEFQHVALAGPLGFSAMLSSAPYRFTYEIPKNTTPGRYHVAAFSIIKPGQLVYSDPIDLAVERVERLTSIFTEPSTLEFWKPGDFGPLRVVGRYADGSQTDITDSLNTTYRSENPAVATISAAGIVTAVGPGTTRIVVNGTYSLPVLVRPPLIVRPPRTTMHASETQQFDFLAFDSSVSDVEWSIAPAGRGSITSSGLYTAPASVSSQRTVTVTARNPANSKQAATAIVTLVPGRQ